MAGRTIQIYLPNGDPKGIRKASLATDKIEVIQLPRTIFTENKKIVSFSGIYILVDTLRTEKPQIYIGKGNVDSRVSSHENKKDFWNILFAVKLIDNSGFNETHCRYLEYYFINKAKELKLADTSENAQTPKEPKLSEIVLSELEHYIGVIEILLSTLGLKCFQKSDSEKEKELFYCKGNSGNIGIGEYTEDGFLLHKGAICRKNIWKGTTNICRRNELVENKILVEKNGFYVLTEDTMFSSVSTAASIVLARSANGWTEWKNKDGKTLDSLKRK